MAPVVTAVQPPIPMTKVKRPIPPVIQTNGAGSVRPSPSPSPSMSTKKAPNSAKAGSISVASNGGGTQVARPQDRSRRESSAHLAGRASRNSAGLRSASLAADTSAQAAEPPPYVVSDSYILRKFAGNPPSLVIHMYQTHFRFDAQTGIFAYTSPMKLFLEHIKSRTVPHEFLFELAQADVSFYEGCLIVQIHDHRSAAEENGTPKPSPGANTTAASSVHNYNPYLTPSPYVPYPSNQPKGEPDGDAAIDGETKETQDKDETMAAPDLPTEAKSSPPPKPRTYTVVLHPTMQSLRTDLLIKAGTPRGASDGKDGLVPPPTPLTAVPPSAGAGSMPPPAKRQKREKMEVDGRNIYEVEAEILLKTTAPLMLEPTKNALETAALLEAKSHPMHSEPPPQPKARKRTVAEMAADQALIADQERYLLILDERISSASGGGQGASAGADGDRRGGAGPFEPQFGRFQVIERIKAEHKEKKEQERIKQAANQKRLEQQRQQQQAAEQQAAQLRQVEAERARREAAAREAQLRQQQQQEQRKLAAAQAQAAKQAAQKNLKAQNAKAAAAAKAKANANASAGANAAAASASASATPNGAQQNGAQNPQATPRFHQQVGQQQQPPSPVVQQGTPHSMSSPMPGAVPMKLSNSNMAASPPRPSSVVQHTPMAVPMSRNMSARGSQQSHPAGTPRMTHSTPNMGHATPINRPAVIQTPRMSQASPPPAMMAQGSQMGGVMNGQGLPQNAMAARMAAQQQQQRLMMQAGLMPGGMGAQNLSPQQQQQQRIQQLLMQQQHQMAQQQQRNGMVNPIAQQYAASMMQMQGQMTPQMQAQMARLNQANQANQMNQMAMGQMPMGQMGGQIPNQMGRQMMPNQAAMMNGGGAGAGANNVGMRAAMIQMQQQAQQQQQQQNNQQFMELVRQRGQQIFRNHINGLAEKYGGATENIPPEILEKFKVSCLNQARNMLSNMGNMSPQQMQQLAAQRAQAQAAQQQQQMAMQHQGMMGHQGM